MPEAGRLRLGLRGFNRRKNRPFRGDQRLQRSKQRIQRGRFSRSHQSGPGQSEPMSRSRWIAIVVAAVAGFGLADSGYLTIKHLQGSFIRCGDECSAVLGSRYAEGIAGIPLAGFGAMAYATVLLGAVLAACGLEVGRRVLALVAPAM